MHSFDLEQHLKGIYSTFPEARRQPIVGITANYSDGDATLRDRYYWQIVAAGGTPVIVPPVPDKDVIANTLDHIDALLLTGGGDYNPLWADEQPSPRLHSINAERDLAELLTTRLAYNRQMPILGICRGLQTIAMALEGHVQQDITDNPQHIKHSQDADRSEPTHNITVTRDTMLASIYDAEEFAVNSFHHQAVDDPGSHLIATAYADDGTIEAVESSEHKPIMGVQWHPEWLDEDGLPLFRWLVKEATLYADAKRFHTRNITLDTHCDTPMFFPQGVNFMKRDTRILVDLHKMTDSHQDAVTMVAYLPQPKEGETFADIAPFPTEGPRAYADLIFDKIDETVLGDSRHIALARTPADIEANKRMGRKSLMIGIENGLALEHDLTNIEHFAQRGIVYITLCHNGDNLICDSARRSCATNGGVSDFGAQVIDEMNRLCIMVDMSHAGEKSFYDALDISSTPIVCSHSDCRALCDVPRNLTDDQLRALAQKGGVAHITLYAGFLRTDGEACINDAMEHLEHAISIMGVEHVGLGTDFDGDGGIPGLANSSELINFTRELLRRRYSEEEMAMIWGGNWLRVMNEVQQSRQQ